MILRIIATLAVTLAVLSFAASGAQPTGTFTFQGALRDTNVAANGSYDFRFSLFDDALAGYQIGTTVDLQAVSVSRGLFTVPVDFGLAAFNGQQRWLEIQVRPVGGVQYTKLTPRLEITSSPIASYAHQARLALPYADDVSTVETLFALTQSGTGMVADFTAANPGTVLPALDVLSAGMAEAGRFVTTNVANGAPAILAFSGGIGPALRATGAIAGDFLGNVDVSGTLTPASFRLQAGAAVGRVLTSDATGLATWQAAVSYSAGAGLQLIGTVFSVADSGIVTSMIAPSAVTTSRLADQSVTSAKIADLSITTADLAAHSVTTDKIADHSITAADLADNSVTTAKIVDAAVTNAKIADFAISTFKLADNSVTSAKLADGSVTTAKIVDGAISTNKLASASVTTDKIADLSITAADLADSSVTTAKIVNAAVTNSKIADVAITANKLASASVTSDKIANNSVASAGLASDVASLAKVSGGTLANSGGALSASVAFAAAGTISSAQSSEMLINAISARAVDPGVAVTIRSDATIGTTTGMYCGVRISAAIAGTYRVVVPIDVPLMLYGRKPTAWAVTTHYSDASASNYITRTRVFNTHMNETPITITDNTDRTSADHSSYSVSGPSLFQEEWRGKAIEYQVSLAAGGWLSIGTIVVTYTY